jgi:hypothetical protein
MRTLATSRRGGIIGKLLLGVLVLLAIAAAVWIFFLPAIASYSFRSKTGFSAQFDSLSTNPLTGSMQARGVVVTNPPEFPRPDFAHVNAFDLRLAPLSLLRDRLEMPLVVIDVERVTVVTAADGSNNVSLLRERLAQDEPGRETEELPFHIGRLEVRFATVQIVDYSQGREPRVREVRLNINRVFTDVTDASQIARPLLADFARAGVSEVLAGSLMLLLPEQLSGPLGEALGGAGGLLEDVAKPVGDLIKGLFNSGREERQEPPPPGRR